MMERTSRSIALAAVLLTGLTACSSADGGGGSGDQTLLVWDTGILGLENGSEDVENSFIDRMAADFEEANPGVDIEVVRQSGGDITANSAQFQAASIAGDGPDVRIQFAGGPTTSFSEFFTDLEPLLTPEIIDSMAGIDVNREDFSPDGRLVGMPYGAGNLFTVFQNHAVLEEAGLDPADSPQTWEELVANGQQVVDRTDKNGFWAANLEGYVGAWMISALVGGQLGESAFTQMYAGEIPVDDPAMVEAYQAFAAWGASGLVNPDAGQVANSDSTAGFVDGSSAYYLVGSWENQAMLDAFGEEGVSSFFIPTLEGSPYPNIGAGGPEIAISVTEYSEKKELAGEFLRFLAQPENQDVFVELFQTQGSNHVEGDPSKIENPLLREQIEQLGEATDGVVFAFDSVMPQATIDLFYRLNAAVFLGTTTPEDAVAQLAASYEQEIANQ
jgi:ABC-type glycerol-3-phosphate transport system substrate-binding protein